MRLLAIVTARGGSKGFPGKNLARLAGRELVNWARRALEGLRTGQPGIVIHLSTDSAEIAAAWPADARPARLRPAALAADASTSVDVALHELDAAAAEGRACDAVLVLQPTSPLVTTADLAALVAVCAAGAEAAIGVTPSPHPVQWALRRCADGLLCPLLPDSESRRQDLPQTWMPMGIYLVRASTLRRERSLAPPGLTIGVPVPAGRAIDIDHPCDLEAASLALAASHRERPFSIGNRSVGGGARCFIIAEAGVNHNGDERLAMELVAAAAAAGADAVKFQTFRTSALVTAAARQCAYQTANTGRDGAQEAMLRALELDDAVFARLQAEAARLGLAFLSTPFDWGSAEMLHRLGVDAFKLGSGELTNLPYLARLAALGRPLIISTGMSTLDEVEDAAACVRAAGDPPVAWLHCVSSYPAPEAQSNLRAMHSLRTALGGPVGMSDHSPGSAVSIAAVALGAQLLEKHLTLDRRLPGPDHAASVEPAELAELVRQVRLAESALGDGIKRPMPSELDTAAQARRSLVAARDLVAGTILCESDLAAKRPAGGLPPGRLGEMVGRRLLRDLPADGVLRMEDVA